jgi:hypothetical protein
MSMSRRTVLSNAAGAAVGFASTCSGRIARRSRTGSNDVLA